MSFCLFGFNEQEMATLFSRNGKSDQEMLQSLHERFNEQELPSYVVRYLEQEVSSGAHRISFHKPSGFGTAASRYTEEEKEGIRRTKGIFATNEYRRSELPDARHHLKIFHNDRGRARLFYKINGGAVRFLQNRR